MSGTGRGAVETLREAARLMRERAQAATPSPWHVAKSGAIDAGEYDTVLEPGRVDCGAYCQGGSSTFEWGQSGDPEHIASWHPAVALAVAAWLDHAAEKAAEWNYVVPMEHPEALAVARAYLGES